MKRLLLLFSLVIVCTGVARAQLPNGSIAPDFTVTDLDGNSWNLYTLLNEGKTVYLDFSATWCGPCWSYHNSGALEGIWDQYGPPGTNEAFVIFIESDASTNTACLYGPSGCVGGTQGDWVTGTPYPIADDASVAGSYAISYYPTIYMVCPADKKIYETGQLSTSGQWAQRAAKCAPPPLQVLPSTVQNVKCKGSSTGKINITVSGASGPYTYLWSNGATTQNLNNIPAGTYTVTVSNPIGSQGISDPIEVLEPATDLTMEVVSITDAGCNGVKGNITMEASGGWENFSYAWNNGQNTETAFNLNPGTYTCTVTDDLGCTKTSSATVAPPVLPVSVIAPPPSITCAAPVIQIDGTQSSSGPEYSYQWYAGQGGNIVSGSTTETPSVNAAGVYTLQVVNINNTCSATSNTTVSANTTPPAADAGPAQTVSCTQPTATLQGSGSSGTNFSYLWTASNGGNITAGANTLSPTVNAAGTYTLKVTNATNGCSTTAATSVSGNNTAPSVSTSNGTLTCISTSVVLTTNTDASAPTFAWTGPNGFTSSEQSPTVSAAGPYALIVTNTTTGCTNTAQATVSSNTNAPGASASGASLTCISNSVTITASTSSSNTVGFAWTGPNGFSASLQNPSVSVAGAYTVVVTDSTNFCTSTAVATVGSNTTAPNAAAATPGNLNCNTTQVQLDGVGSSVGANFSYTWSTTNGNIVSGGNTLAPTVDAVGQYTLLVSNSDNGCTATANATVAQSPAVNTSASSADVSCFGGANGSANATATGGNGSFSYLWSNGATTSAVSNLSIGTYNYTVTDAEGCTATGSATVNQPADLLANAGATAQTSNGVNDGTASAAPSGGVAPYTYVWSNGATSATITGLAPGSYTVSVSDANNCTDVQTVTVNSFNCALSANISSANISCFGANNGSAAVSLVGASEPITYLWSNGATSASVSNLSAGQYTVSVNDGNNCPAILNVSISEPTAVAPNAVATSETAAGANDGSAAATPTGGSAPYSYAWSNGATSASITGLAPGVYTVIVTDAANCSSTQSVTVAAFNCVLGYQSIVSNISCFGANNGVITLSINGGTAPYTYAWSNGGTTATITSLAAGTYTASVTDVNGCILVSSSSVSEPSAFSAFSIQSTQPECANQASGSITAEISGATPPYTYLWSNGATTNSISNLNAGTYSVVVTDSNGCQSSTSVALNTSDNVPPTISVQNATLALGSAGSVEVSAAALFAQAADNCTVASISFSPASFDCAQLGEHVVTATVTDVAGLSATATATVSVVDNTAPVLTCPANKVVCAYDNKVEYAMPTIADNCTASAPATLLSGIASGSEFPVGATTTQVFSFTDAGGNSGTCSFDITVGAVVTISNIAVTDDNNNQGVGAIDITIAGAPAGLTFVWEANDGIVVGTTEDIQNLKAGFYTVKIYDANGCLFTTDAIEVRSIVASHEPVWMNAVRIQPNPTEGPVKIALGSMISGEVEIAVVNTTGQMVRQIFVSNPTVVELDCSELPTGVYALRIRSGNETGARLLMIAR